MVRIVEHEFTARGAAAELLRSRDPEVLIEGPLLAGTGKSRACLEKIDILCQQYPRIRALLCRQTLKSVRESIQVTLEERVWWPEHECLRNNISREHRTHYDYDNGSRIVLGGLDNPDKTFSTEYDLVFVEEAIEVGLDSWEKLLRVNRNWRMPFQQAIAATNPGSKFHWLNKRPEQTWEAPDDIPGLAAVRPSNGMQMLRLLSRHKDNPALWDEERCEWTAAGAAYLSTLAHMTGVRRKRLLNGEWVSEEGLVFEEYDSGIHTIEREALLVDPAHPEKGSRIKWAIGSMDFGFRNPGCFQVWGVDGRGAMYCLAEVYRAEKQLDWWAEEIQKLIHEFGVLRIVADGAEPRSIEYLNGLLMAPGGRSEPGFVRPAEKDIQVGLARMHDALAPLEGPPAMYWVRNRLRAGLDPKCLAAGKPTSSTDEITAFVWLKTEDGRPIKEQPDPACADHGLDAARYAAVEVFGKDLTPPVDKPMCAPGTTEWHFGHQDIWDRIRDREEGLEAARPRDDYL
ncbi:MAG: phage terminase large subunit [Acidimicrobiales bacterium]|nr:phage terminase large subunit [Acidimicrobiales bacterium]